MMVLTGIYAENYKGFKRLDLSLKKINYVIGKNGSGKSTICRLIPLIIESMYSDAIEFSPLGIDLAGSFEDLSHTQSEAAVVTLGATFSLNSQSLQFRTSIIFSTEQKRVLVSKFEWIVGQNVSFTAELTEATRDKAIYTSSLPFDNLSFSGLLPNRSTINEEQIEGLAQFFESVEQLRSSLTYLGPFRENLKRVFPNSLKEYSNVGSRGEFAPYILSRDKKANNDQLHIKIQKWMTNNFGGKFIKCKPENQHFSIMVNSGDKQNNIIDDGIGYSQLLPIIVSRLSKVSTRNYSIEIAEQPELHLHPSACASVTDLYLTALEESGTVVLETHSKEMVLRLRRRVAEAKDKSILEQISIIYTEQKTDGCCIDFINITPEGGVDWWPEGVFEESFEEVLAISEAQNAR